MAIEGQALTEHKTTFIGALNRLKKALNPSREELTTLRAVLKQKHPQGASERELQIFIELWEQEANEHTQNAAR